MGLELLGKSKIVRCHILCAAKQSTDNTRNVAAWLGFAFEGGLVYLLCPGILVYFMAEEAI